MATNSRLRPIAGDRSKRDILRIASYRLPILSAVFFLLMLAAPLFAQSPKAVITGPRDSRPGALVVLDASESTGTGRLWLLAVSPEETSFLPVESGLKCIFASPTPGVYTFVLVVAGTNANGGAAADMATHTITLRGGTIPPPTPPPVVVTPDPILPPSQLTGEAYLIVIRRNEDLTADEAAVLVKMRSWVDNQLGKVQQLEFPPDADDGAVKSYLAKLPAGAELPYVFLARPRKDGKGAAVIWNGELPARAEDLQAKVLELAL